MQSAAEICNLGLTEIGNTAFIDALNEATAEAQVANAVWAHCLKAALKLCQPKFARKRATLAPILNGERTNWAFAYTLPNDYIHLEGIPVNGTVVPVAEVRTEYEMEGGVILTNIDNLEIVYIYYLEDVTKYDEDFVEVLALFLASKFAAGVKKDYKMALDLDRRSKAAAYQYRADNFNNHDIQKFEPETPSYRVRL